MRKDFGAKPLTYPQPVLIRGSYDKDGNPDAMNAAWGGISGIQTVLQSAFSEGCGKGRVTPVQLARVMSEQPAKAFGLWGKKGALKEGFDADIVLLDPNRAWEITAEQLYYKNKISGFLGKKGVGMPVMTILRGEIIAENGSWTGKKGFGKVLRKGSIS